MENMALNINTCYLDSNCNYQILANKCFVIIKDEKFGKVSCKSTQNVTYATVYIFLISVVVWRIFTYYSLLENILANSSNLIDSRQ